MRARKLIPWLPARRPPPEAGLHFSPGSALFLLATGVIGLVGMDTDANLLIVLFGLCVGAVLVSGLSAWISLSGLEITRAAPDSVVAEQPFELRYQVHNRQRWLAAHALHLVDLVDARGGGATPECFIPVIRAGESISVSVPVRFDRRGRVALDALVVATRFPFGLFTRYATVSLPQSLFVFPRLGAVRERRWLASRHAEITGDTGVLARRGDDEFYGLREYRAGDSPRRIHWRRSARAGTLVVREMAAAGTMRLWIVIDTRVPRNDAYAAARLEIAIRCAATVACDALENNRKVGLICNGEPWLVLPPGGGRDFRLRILRELAMRADNPDDRLLDRLARVKWPSHRRGSGLVFAGRSNDDLPDVLRLLSHRIGSVAVYLPGTPAFDAIYSGGSLPRRAGGLSPEPPRRWVSSSGALR